MPPVVVAAFIACDHRRPAADVLVMLPYLGPPPTCAAEPQVPSEISFDVALHEQRLLASASDGGDSQQGFTVLNTEHAADFQCLGVDLPSAKDTAYQITELVQHACPLGAELLHHANVFVCDERVPLGLQRGRQCDPFEGGSGGFGIAHGAPCISLAFIFDHLAFSPVALPPTAGYAVGRGTPFTRLLLTTHYKLPAASTGSDLIGRNFSVGVRLNLSTSPRPHRASTVLFQNMGFSVPPHTRGFEVSAHLDAPTVTAMLGRSMALANNGSLTLHQIHLHSHGHAHRISFVRNRNGREDVLFADTNYSQTSWHDKWHKLPEGTTLRRGDALRCVCIFDNDDPSGVALHWGMVTGRDDEEMCGCMFVYSPHDAFDLAPKAAVTTEQHGTTLL